ncbi:MAG: hypothetical protein M1361_02385 [Patescibacteria group bacterium]|nr:hypothetical protein [Patescibacteria group bacterium]MCL5224425.1 hypothetical protein [Patescibacteria group bacterium]
MKLTVGMAIIAAVLGTAFYLYTALTTQTSTRYAQAKDDTSNPGASGPAVPQASQYQGL